MNQNVTFVVTKLTQEQMKITPILWTQYPKNAPKDTQFPIKIRVQDGKKRHLIPINAKASKDQWDAAKGRVRVDKRPNGADINLQIIQKCNEIERGHLSGQSIAQESASDDFYHHFETQVEYSRLKHSEHHYKKMKTVLTKMRAYRSNLKIHEVTHSFLTGYEMYLMGDKVKNDTNTIHDNMARIKTVIMHLVKSGLIEYHKNPFLTFKPEKKRVHRDRISYQEVLKMGKAKLDGNNEKARDMFLFSFYCAGIRFGDLCRLAKSNFKGARLVYTMNKTDRRRNIKLMPQALEIAKKYNYTFGIKTNFESISAANAMLNKSLKRVCEKLEINPISFHCSRHSFADYAVKMKLPIHTLKDLLGHTKLETTEVYMEDFYEEEADEAMNTLFG